MTTDRYPSGSSDPLIQVWNQIRTLEERVDASLRRNPLNNGVFSGTLRKVDPETGETILEFGEAGFRMLDADGETRLIIGRTGGDHYGILVMDADGETARLWIDERGILTPYLTVPAVAVDDFIAVTAGTFTTTHRAQFESVSHQGVYAWLTATGDPATTGEIRLHIPLTGAVTDTIAVPAGGQVTEQFRWLHGLDLNTGPVIVEVQARRTAGAGNINVYRPPGMSLTAPGLCSTDGLGV